MFLQNLLCARFDAKGDVKEKAGSPLTFGPNSVTRFLAKHDMCLAVTGSSCCTNGYHFYADRKLLTLTSSNLWGNLKAILSIDDNHFGTIYVSHDTHSQSSIPPNTVLLLQAQVKILTRGTRSFEYRVKTPASTAWWKDSGYLMVYL